VRGPPCESGRGEATLERAASAPGLHPPRGRVSGAAAMGAPLGGHVAAAEARPPRPRRQVALGGVEARGHGSLLPLPDGPGRVLAAEDAPRHRGRRLSQSPASPSALQG
ncbi:unnamed protein product, partial [Prorocentrum cordatum]